MLKSLQKKFQSRHRVEDRLSNSPHLSGCEDTDPSASRTTTNIVPVTLRNNTVTPVKSCTSISDVKQTTHQQDQNATSPKHDGAHAGSHGCKKKDYWLLAVEELKCEEPPLSDMIDALQHAAVSNGAGNDFKARLLQATEAARQNVATKKWRVNIGGRDIVLREELDRMFKAITMFKDVGQAAGAIDPLHVGLPLAGFCILMQVVTSDLEQYTTMIAGLQEVVTILARYQEIEIIYIRREQTSLKQEFEQRLIALYKHIIRYQLSAISYYQRSTMLRFLRAIPKLDDLKEVVNNIRGEDAACRMIGQVFDSQDANSRHQELLEQLNRFDQKLSTYVRDTTTASMSVHWVVPRSVNAFFIGRNDILDQLKDSLRDGLLASRPDGTSRVVVVVTGIGGLGKSELCLQLANRVRALFWGVFWVDVSTPTTAEAGFREIASLIDLPRQSTRNAIQGLANIKHPWLLVLDNADDPRFDYQDYIPSGSAGAVLITSRNVECRRYATGNHIALDKLADSEAKSLLFRAAEVDLVEERVYHSQAQKICQLLNSYPLALIQAGAYIARGHCTLEAYPTVFQRQSSRLLKFHPSQARSRYQNVYTTFEASAEILQTMKADDNGHDAFQLLDFLTTVGNQQFPLSFFESVWQGARRTRSKAACSKTHFELSEWHASALPSFILLDLYEWDPFRLMEAVHLLSTLSIVFVSETADGFQTLSLHPLIHAWARARLDEEHRRLSLVASLCLFSAMRPYSLFWRTQCWQIRPHIYSLLTFRLEELFARGPTAMVARALTMIGNLMHYLSDSAKLSIFLPDMFAYINLDPRKVKREWVNLYYLESSRLLAQCSTDADTETAILLREQSVDCLTSLPENSTERFTAEIQLAFAYHAAGRIQLAQPLLERALTSCNDLDLERFAALLQNARHRLAVIYLNHGQAREAITLLEPTLQEKQQVLLDHDPRRLLSEMTLGVAYRRVGRTEEAVAILEHVVEVKRRQLIEYSEDLEYIEYELAMAYHAQGQDGKAEKLLRHLQHQLGESLKPS